MASKPLALALLFLLSVSLASLPAQGSPPATSPVALQGYLAELLGNAVTDGVKHYALTVDAAGDVLRMETYDPSVPQVTVSAGSLNVDFPGPMVRVGGFIYIFGALDQTTGLETRTTYRYDISAGTFSTMAAPIPSVLDHDAAAFTDGQFAYLVHCHSFPCHVQRYLVPADAWSVSSIEVPTFGDASPRTATYGIADGRQIGVVLSDGFFPPPKGLFIIDFSAGTATVHDDVLPFSGVQASLAWAGDDLLIFGGWEDGYAIQRYDYAADAATVLPETLPGYTPRSSATSVGDCAYIFGRDESSIDHWNFGPGDASACENDGCLMDTDCDGVADPNDNCDDVPNAGQADGDGDGLGDACDSQVDPDPCDPAAGDLDGDGISNACDPDRDGDGVGNPNDNCPGVPNAGQADSDGDRVGDACDQTQSGNPCQVHCGATGGGGGGGGGTGGGGGGTSGGGGTGGNSGGGTTGSETTGGNSQGEDGAAGTPETAGSTASQGTGSSEADGESLLQAWMRLRAKPAGGDSPATGLGGPSGPGGDPMEEDEAEKSGAAPLGARVTTPAPSDPGPAVAAASGAGVLAAAAAWLTRYRWWALAAVAFGRIRRKNALDHPMRLAIVDLTATRPGIHFLQLKREVGTGRGNLEHHLRVLLAAGLVRETKEKGFRCFFPPQAATPEALAQAPVLKTERAQGILRAVQAQPGLTLAELARAVGCTYRGAAYHVERLHSVGAARMEAGEDALRVYPMTLRAPA